MNFKFNTMKLFTFITHIKLMSISSGLFFNPLTLNNIGCFFFEKLKRHITFEVNTFLCKRLKLNIIIL